jgi:hypothetical protein
MPRAMTIIEARSLRSRDDGVSPHLLKLSSSRRDSNADDKSLRDIALD